MAWVPCRRILLQDQWYSNTHNDSNKHKQACNNQQVSSCLRGSFGFSRVALLIINVSSTFRLVAGFNIMHLISNAHVDHLIVHF